MKYVKFIYRRVGKRIAQARRKQSMSQEDLAWITRLDRTYLARIEQGKVNPTIKILYRISKKLQVKVWHLLKEI